MGLLHFVQTQTINTSYYKQHQLAKIDHQLAVVNGIYDDVMNINNYKMKKRQLLLYTWAMSHEKTSVELVK